MFFKQRFFPYKYFTILTVVILFALFTGNNTGTHGKTSLSTILHLVSTAYAGESAEKKDTVLDVRHAPVPSEWTNPVNALFALWTWFPCMKKGAGVMEEGAVATVELSERARKLAQVKTDVVGFGR